MQRLWIFAVIGIAAFAPGDGLAQARPSTDVWVVPLTDAGNAVRVGEPRNLTKRTGYDNQPSFTRDSKSVLFTVIGADEQADIWRVPVDGGSATRMTQTVESEYSAAVTPDGQAYSVIRVERDSTQRLWRFPFDGGAPSLVLERIKPVGYHAWAGDNRLVLFVLGQPASLQVADVRTGTADTVARNIGRALAKVPGRDAVTFQQVVRDSGSWIAELDVRTNQARRLMKPPAGADFHVWTPQGALLAAAGSQVLIWTNNQWDQVADLTRWGVRGISRLAVSPDGRWLAFVAEDQASR